MTENKYTQDLDDLKWFAKAKENDIKVGTPAFNLLIEFYKQQHWLISSITQNP